MKKYNFVEFIAATESESFDNINAESLQWATNFVECYNNNWHHMIHRGDCTNEPILCSLCLFELYLKQYREYTTFNKIP